MSESIRLFLKQNLKLYFLFLIVMLIGGLFLPIIPMTSRVSCLIHSRYSPGYYDCDWYISSLSPLSSNYWESTYVRQLPADLGTPFGLPFFLGISILVIINLLLSCLLTYLSKKFKFKIIPALVILILPFIFFGACGDGRSPSLYLGEYSSHPICLAAAFPVWIFIWPLYILSYAQGGFLEAPFGQFLNNGFVYVVLAGYFYLIYRLGRSIFKKLSNRSRLKGGS